MRTITVFSLLLLFGVAAGCGGQKAIQKADLGDIPDWFMNPPRDSNIDNPKMLYGAATEVSQDMQFAINKAETAARSNIARQLETTVKGLMAKFREETGSGQDPQLLQMSTEVEKNIVNTKITGTRIAKQQIVRDGNLFRAYVLVEYSTEAAKRALIDDIKKNEQAYTRYRASKAFADLEEEVEKQAK
ncbi:MAG: LPP20 family lipoprotein [Chlorobiales bacterium]